MQIFDVCFPLSIVNQEDQGGRTKRIEKILIASPTFI